MFLLCLTYFTQYCIAPGNSARCYVAVWMEGSLGENGYMYMYS